MERENIVTLNLCIVKRHFDLLWDKGDDQFHGQGKEDHEELEGEDTKARGKNWWRKVIVLGNWSLYFLTLSSHGMFESSSELGHSPHQAAPSY